MISGFHIYQMKAAEARHGPYESLEDLERLLAFKIEAISKTKGELDALKARQSSLQALIGRSNYSQIIFKLAGMMKGNIWLENLTIKRGAEATQIQLSGFSLENEELANFLNKLSDDPVFSDVQLKYAKGERMNVGGEEEEVQLALIHFHIVSSIAGAQRP
jgi:Tfp pilus assembly protein PilN